MNRTTFSLEIFGDRVAKEMYTARGDNKAYLDRLKHLLRTAINEELTDCQKSAVIGFYYEGKTVTELANILGVNKSTVSRHLNRAKEKLSATLKYGMYPLFSEGD